MRKICAVALAAVAAGGLLAGGAAAAAEAATIRLEETVVTAARVAAPLASTPVAVGHLPAKVIAEVHPQLISDVLDRVPGVHMVDLGNEQHSMSIRQPMGTAAVYQYLEDNIPIRPIGVFNHNALNEINLAGSSDIEVLRGASSSLYGSNAVGGTVNFLTRAPSSKPESWLGLRGSDQGYARIDAGASTTAGDWGVMAAFYHSAVRDSWREHSDARKDALSLRIDGVLSDDHWLKTVLSHTDLDTDMAGTLGETAYRKTPAKSDMTFTERTDRATRLSSTLESDWGDERSTQLTLYLRDNRHGQIPSYTLGQCAPSPTCSTNGTRNDNGYQSLGVDMQWRQSLWQGQWLLGLIMDRTRNRYDEDALSVVRAEDRHYVAYAVASKRRDYAVDIDNPALYTQVQWQPVPDWHLVMGLRYDRIQYDFNNHLVPAASTGADDQSQTFSHLSPSMGAVYAWGPHDDLFVNLSQAFVPPEVSQLYSSLAVPDLREAVFGNRELGWRHRFADKGSMEASLYRLDGEDEIVSYTVSTSPLLRENRNAGKTRHEGLELGANYTLNEALSLFVSGSIARHRFQRYQPASSENYDGNDMPSAPWHMLTAGLDWHVMPDLVLSPELQHIGAYWMNNSNTVRYPGHSVMHLRTRWQYQSLEVFLQIMNVADAHHATSASSSYKSGSYLPDTQNSYMPGDPRTLLLGVQYRWKSL